jgi:hypothetical protein
VSSCVPLLCVCHTYLAACLVHTSVFPAQQLHHLILFAASWRHVVRTEVWLHLLLTSALNWGYWSSVRPSRFIPGMEPQYLFYRTLDGPQSLSGCFEKDRNNFLHPGIRNLDHSARIPVSIQTALSRLMPSPSNLLNCPALQLLAGGINWSVSTRHWNLIVPVTHKSIICFTEYRWVEQKWGRPAHNPVVHSLALCYLLITNCRLSSSVVGNNGIWIRRHMNDSQPINSEGSVGSADYRQ